MGFIFYADDGLLASMRAERLQQESNVLTNFFDRLLLIINSSKIVIMVRQIFQLVVVHSTEAEYMDDDGGYDAPRLPYPTCMVPGVLCRSGIWITEGLP